MVSILYIRKYLYNIIEIQTLFSAETLRKYPSLPILNRTCMKDYPIPGTNKVIEKGVEVFIPVYGLQRDEKYYEEPDKFNPDRFNEENSAGKNLLNRPYMPFGEGNKYV